jgi:hypothetical protein
VARCQQGRSLTQIASELHTTIDVIRRLIDRYGLRHPSQPAR